MKKIFFLMICSTLLLSACGNAETVSQPSVSESLAESSVESLEEASKTLGNIDLVNEKIKAFTESADYKNADTDGNSAEDDELWEKMNQAQEKIKTFLESEDYKNSDKDKKVEMAMKFVEELKNDGFIAHYDYDEGNELISYNHLNGVLGGISFHDFSEKIDGLAMN